MKTSKKSQQIAKQIFRVSQDSGRMSETRLRKFANLLSSEGSIKSREILTSLKNLVEREQKKSEVVIESAFAITKTDKDKIRSHFEKKIPNKLDLKEVANKELISGLRIKFGDNVWENTILSNLQKLKGTSNS